MVHTRLQEEEENRESTGHFYCSIKKEDIWKILILDKLFSILVFDTSDEAVLWRQWFSWNRYWGECPSNGTVKFTFMLHSTDGLIRFDKRCSRWMFPICTQVEQYRTIVGIGNDSEKWLITLTADRFPIRRKRRSLSIYYSQSFVKQEINAENISIIAPF